jgi:hypothetical protein
MELYFYDSLVIILPVSEGPIMSINVRGLYKCEGFV